VRGLAGLLAAIVVLATATACGSTHHSANGARVGSYAYSGRLYSVRQVMSAFAALGLELHRGARRAPGLVFLLNNRRLGPERIPSPARIVTVVVVTRPASADSSTSLPGRVTRYANIEAFSKQYVLDEVRGAMSSLRWRTRAQVKPGRHLIVLADSIGGIRLGESRRSVEKTFGPGLSKRRGLVRYFGGHLLVNYWFHDGLYHRVMYLQTRWGGYHTRSGVRAGSSREELRSLYVSCLSQTECWLQAGPTPDPVGTIFTMRHGKVASILIGSFG
jgi:hypothetical protein